MGGLEKKIVQRFKTLLMKKAFFHHVILYGSRARGDDDEDSDLDILVIVDKLTPQIEAFISECAWEAGFPYDIVVVPVAFSKNDWENGPERYSLLAQAIRSEGVYL